MHRKFALRGVSYIIAGLQQNIRKFQKSLRAIAPRFPTLGLIFARDRT